jgi:outer membrane protein assembly factor BamB
VCGEGYHEDTEGRLICLDLEPVRKSGGKEPPKLAWFFQATDHAEASPVIHEGKVITGCGVDGVWCVELATGKILWHITGEPDAYDLKEGPKTAALASLAGKTVVVTGTVARLNAMAKDKNDPGTMQIDVKDFHEAAQAPVPLMDSCRTLERTEFGKIVKDEKGVHLVPPYSNPDSEASPVAITLPSKEQRVVFGSGMHGQRVVCANAETGAVIWKVDTDYPAFGAPAISGDRVVVGIGKGDFVEGASDPAGVILGISLADGKLLWKTKTPDTFLGSIALQDGRGYACSKDGNVYVVDLQNGQIVQKLPTGAPMVGSAAVTADSIYAANMGGKVVAFDRKSLALRTSFALAPGTEIISSPAIANGKLFVGSRDKGIFAVADRPAGQEGPTVARPWNGPGGDAGRTGCADDRGLPVLTGETYDLKWPTPPELSKPVTGPLAACGSFVTAAFEDELVELDGTTGRILWKAPGKFAFLQALPEVLLARTAKGDWQAFDPQTGRKLERPPGSEGLVFDHLAFRIDQNELLCTSETGDAVLWRSPLDSPAPFPPSVAGGRVFVLLKGKDKAKGFLSAFRIVDGSPAWTQELDEAPVSHPVASASWVAVAIADDRVAVLGAADGKAIEPVKVGGPAVAPALYRDTLVVAGKERTACYDLAALGWVGNYKDEDNIGTATGQPVVCRETIWVGTTKKGLLAIGVPKK